MTLDSGAPSPPTTLTILIADDDPDILLLMTLRLSNAGYHILVAADGQQALDRIIEHRPQMALLDLMMPRLTGAEVLIRLRASDATRNLPVILISASFHGDRSDYEHLDVLARADDYISKPFGRGVLQTHVNALFDR